jgi:TRAP-type mannitol/chloroaromatic compound transport system permease small subunit
MRSLVVLSRWIDRINTMIGEASGWLVLVIIMIGSGNAIIRKLFNTSSNA